MNKKKGIFRKGDLIIASKSREVIRKNRVPFRLPRKQFCFFTALFRSAGYVPEKTLILRLFHGHADKEMALYALAYRLRKSLGPQLASRIKNKRNKGWTYVQPRLRKSAL